MARLPTPGGDKGSWGTILNDYLRREHNSDGTHKTATILSTPGQADLAAMSDPATAKGFSWRALTKGDVGLSNADNTSDADKPISAATQAALDTKAQIGGELGGTASSPQLKNIIRVANVRDYGAVGDGTTDDSSAISAALATLTDGGTLYFPRGTYMANSITTVSSGAIRLTLLGDGIDASIIKGNASVDHVIKMRTAGRVSSLTVDANAMCSNALAITTTSAATLPLVIIDKVRCRNVNPTANGWPLVVWDQSSSRNPTTPYFITDLHISDVIVEDSQSQTQDGLSITCVDNVYVKSLTLRNLYRSPNFFVIKNLFVDGMVVKNVPHTAGLVFDSGVDKAFLNNVSVEADCTKTWFNGGEVTITNSRFACPSIRIGQSSTNGPTVVRMSNSYTSSVETAGVNGNPTSMIMNNVQFAVASTGQTLAAILDAHASGSTVGNWLFANCTFDNTNATSGWLAASNANVTWQNVYFVNCRVTAGTTTMAGLVKGSNFVVKNVEGLNPDAFYALGNVSGAFILNRVNGATQSLTLTGNGTATISSGRNLGDTLMVQVFQDATGGRTISWPGNLTFVGGGTPSLRTAANAEDLLVLVWDGTNWNGTILGAASGTTTTLSDANGNNAITTTATASAVNSLNVTNAISGGTVTLAVTGSGNNSPFLLKGQGTGGLILRPGANSTGAIALQNAAGTNVLSIDTTNSRLAVGGSTPLSTLDVRGSESHSRTTVADANYTITATDYTIAYTTLTAARTVTLPSATSIIGRTYVVKDEAGTAGTNTITIATTGGQTIDGAATKTINANYGYSKVYSNGSGWFTVS